MFIIVLFVVVPNWEQPKYPAESEWKNKLYFHAVEHSSAVKGSELLIHATILCLLKEARQKRKSIFCMIPLIYNSKK